jgi:hypothetical protein
MGFRFFTASIAIVLLFIPLSCTSIKGANQYTGEAVMYGMVYNYDNIPVSNAEVIVDGKTVGMTDNNGRFVLVSRQRNEFTLCLTKVGYETVTGVFRFEPMDVIHFVMVNADQLVSQAEHAMDEGWYAEVIRLCDRALALNPDRSDASYLKALGLVRLREYGRARLVLEELQRHIGEREYISRVLEALPE